MRDNHHKMVIKLIFVLALVCGGNLNFSKNHISTKVLTSGFACSEAEETAHYWGDRIGDAVQVSSYQACKDVCSITAGCVGWRWTGKKFCEVMGMITSLHHYYSMMSMYPVTVSVSVTCII